ncbi:MAG: class I SAM-dependent methyltransferase [Candidatus Cloacimonetes bacterium]|jgi:hypothetical protein|nr:class I SAM-dependent methyltransferase [Candidatus Cloacimonadota bacterium]
MIKPKTIVEDRRDLTVLIGELGLKRGAELGVETGAFSDYLLSNSNLEKLYSIDAWCEDETATKAVFKRRAKNSINKHFEEAKEVLRKHGKRSEIIRATTFEAVNKFLDGSLDFIYIDASHRFSGVALDLMNWFPKLREGGVFAGHDYWDCYRCEVMEAVNGFFVENKIVLHLTTKGLNSSGKPFYPPTWWGIKDELTKEKYNELVKIASKEIFEQVKYHKDNNGICIIPPYQYEI